MALQDDHLKTEFFEMIEYSMKRPVIMAAIASVLIYFICFTLSFYLLNSEYLHLVTLFSISTIFGLLSMFALFGLTGFVTGLFIEGVELTPEFIKGLSWATLIIFLFVDICFGFKIYTLYSLM